VGVAIDTLQDMETVFAGISLTKVSISMTINAPAAILVAMYRAVGEKQGVSPQELDGTVQNDVLKEYVARGTCIFPPRWARCAASYAKSSATASRRASSSTAFQHQRRHAHVAGKSKGP
jgi:methylmalonyl-CoA mutase N-terminal domain/subunit